MRLGALRSLTATMKTGIPGPEGSLSKWQWADYNQALTELGNEVLGPEGMRVGDRLELPLPALPGQLDRGRHHRGAEEHHRRARARPPEAEVADELRPERRAAGDQAHRPRVPRLPLQAREGPGAGGGALLRRRLSGRRSPSSAGRASRSPRTTAARGSGWSSWPCCSRSPATPARPARCSARAGAALVISAAGSDEQRAEWLPKLASGEATGAFGGFADGTSTLFCDLPTADVVVTFDGEGALLAPASEVDFEPFEAIDATRSYGLVSDAAGERLPGDVDAGRDRLAVAIAAELTGIAAADHGDGRRVRARAPAVRPADRRLPGRRAPLRGDAARHRGVALAHLLRLLDRRRRARVAADGGRDGGRAQRATPAGRCPPRPSRSSAASASPGSTTCSSGSSAAASPAACSAPRATIASASPTSPAWAPASPQPV